MEQATADPVIEAFDQMAPSTVQLECGCQAWSPRSLSCQNCPHLWAHVRACIGAKHWGGCNSLKAA